MLVEWRFVIDFVAGRRVVVTDDIEAELAITEVLSRCCRALDRVDRDLMDTVWHPDGTAGYGPTVRGSVSGLLDVMWANHARLPGHSRQVTSVLIEVDGDGAASEAYVTGTRRSDLDGPRGDVAFGARAVDLMRRRHRRLYE